MLSPCVCALLGKLFFSNSIPQSVLFLSDLSTNTALFIKRRHAALVEHLLHSMLLLLTVLFITCLMAALNNSSLSGFFPLNLVRRKKKKPSLSC